ncbi:MAG: DinB family protein [Thermoanaerobaculia bacterium]
MTPGGEVAGEAPVFATGEPSSGAEIVAALVRLHEESERYLAAIPGAEFVAPQGAQGEKWSPADHTRHLAKSTFPVVKALGLPKIVLRVMFGRASAPSRAFPELRELYRARLAKGASAGRFTPSKRPIPADPAVWQIEVLGRWRTAVTALTAAIPRWQEPALDRYRLPHPLLGPLTVREMLFFTQYHNAHHLNLVASRRD